MINKMQVIDLKLEHIGSYIQIYTENETSYACGTLESFIIHPALNRADIKLVGLNVMPMRLEKTIVIKHNY